MNSHLSCQTVTVAELAIGDSPIARMFYRSCGNKVYFRSTLKAFYSEDKMPAPLWENIIAPQLYDTAPIYLALISDCFVTPTGLVITSQGKLIKDAMNPFGLDTADQAFFDALPVGDNGVVDLSAEQFVNARAVESAIFGREFGESGFYHLMTSLIPRILVARSMLGSAGTVFPILYEPWTDIGMQAMELFGFSDRVMRAEGQTLRVKELYFPAPSQLGDSHFTRAPELLSVYDKICDALESRPVSAHNGRLYVSRADAPTRRIRNEGDLFSRLAGMGFGVVESSRFSLREQIEIFQRAYVVVSAHGAGLANIVFMKPGSLVVELMPPDRIWPSFRVLAALRGLDYIAYVGRSGAGDGDFLVDAELVERVASSAIGDYSRSK